MLKKIPLTLITRNPDQPRQHFDPKALRELADSIRENGLQQPITVRPMEADEEGHKFQVVMGERRFRAHLLLAEDGECADILCHVRKMDDSQTHINAILENLQREEISPIEEAMAYHHAIEEFGYTAEALAKKLGINQSWLIPNRIRLLGLTPDNRDLLVKGVISKKQALAMAELSPNGQQRFLDLVRKGLVSTNKSCEAAAERIAAEEAQTTMPMPKQKRERAPIKPIADKIDALGAAISGLFKDGELTMTADGVDPAEAQKCIEKLKMLRANIGQIERELTCAASMAAL